MHRQPKGCLLFDWGDTLMRDFKDYRGPMKDWPRLEAIPGAPEALAALHPGWTLALATNANDSDEADIRATLQRVDLDQFLDRVYCFKNVGHKKPSVAFYQYILADLGLTNRSACMVGDNFEVDVLGANACGMRAIWFNEHFLESRENVLLRTIHNLNALPDVLENFMVPV
jgi:HAD superfamily hydrolase (TIGR01509 family)